MKIAVASSGLGHVARGVEAWARDTADALHDRSVDVTLFGAGQVETHAPFVVVPCLRRRTRLNKNIVRLAPGFAWRWGLKDGYGLEQFTFWQHLKRHLKKGRFDILHVQDPMVAQWCRRSRAYGRIQTKEILAHGTEEPSSFLKQFDYVQHLVPFHRNQVLSELGMQEPPSGWTVSPNFVDSDRFTPVGSEAERRCIRKELGLPEDAFIVGCAAAVKRSHKRLDYLINEFSMFLEKAKHSSPSTLNSSQASSEVCSLQSDVCRLPVAHLLVAGAREPETNGILPEAREKIGDDVTFLLDYPFENMPRFYKALDVFVLPSLFEMMGIVLAEAMASGVPCIVHDHPVLKYVVGDGGTCIDMQQEGELASQISSLTATQCAALGQAARKHVVRTFSTEVVVQQYINYYHRILGV